MTRDLPLAATCATLAHLTALVVIASATESPHVFGRDAAQFDVILASAAPMRAHAPPLDPTAAPVPSPARDDEQVTRYMRPSFDPAPFPANAPLAERERPDAGSHLQHFAGVDVPVMAQSEPSGIRMASFRRPVAELAIEPLKFELDLPAPMAPLPETPDVVPSPGAPLRGPVAVRNDPPSYPALARRLGYEGKVELYAEILASGVCGEIRIRRSSGHRMLDQAAIRAVRRWRFQPGQRWGRPIATWIMVPIEFNIE